MSKTQLQTNNARLSALITELQGKAAGGGGGSVETCTIALNYPVNILNVTATVYENGIISTKFLDAAYSNTVIIDNVLCGSYLTVASNAIYTPIATITGGGEFIQMGATTRQGYIATSVPGGTMTVSMYDDD